MILSRALGPEGVGQLTLFRQLFLFGAQLASVGLPMAMIHAINKEKMDPNVALRTVLMSCIGLAFVAVLILWTILYFGENFFTEITPLVFASSLIWIPFVLGRAVYYNGCAAFLMAREMTLISTVPQIVLVVFYLCFWLLGDITVDVVLLLEALICGFLSFVFAKKLFKRNSLSVNDNACFDFKFIIRCVPLGLSLVATDLLVSFNGYISLLLLRYFDKSFESLGYYSRGFALATLTVVAVQSLQRFLYAKWAKLEGQERALQVEQSVNIAVTTMLILGGGVVFLAEPLTLFLYGQAFLPAVPIVYVAVIGVGIYIVPRLLQSLFSSDGNARINVYILIVGGATSAILGVLTIPRWAEIGAIWSITAGNTCMAIFAVIVGCVKFQLNWRAMLIPSPRLFINAFLSFRGY
jgi:O-antigen/teichoic acid export membrane protein